ncbi:MAG: hypothetical protein ACOC5T_02600 [Elusimicrobiota bacterium]
MPTNKKESEKKHQKVYRYLKKKFKDCTVKYNGLEGHDVYIQYQDNPRVWIEIKTCDKIVCNGLDHKKMQKHNSSEIFNIHRLGRLKFDRRQLYPYKISQHDDLINLNGWYVFFVGSTLGKYKILFGMPAIDVKLSLKKGLKQLEWGRLSMQSHPNWFQYLTGQVYL